jgi:hypothetical protein
MTPSRATGLMAVLTASTVLPACRPDAGLAKYNSEPEAQITSPVATDALLEGRAVTLRGAASDANHDATELSTRWFVGGAEACAAAVPAPDGTTTCDVVAPDADALDVRLEVIDPDGAVGTASASFAVSPDAAPQVTIASPVEDGVFYSDQLVTFRGTVTDAEDDATALTVWWEDGSVALDVEAVPNGSGEVLGYAVLAEGPHALELHALDSAGNESVATVLVDVGPPNSSPECGISFPADGGVSVDGERVDFRGTAADVDISPALLGVSWSSDKDGIIGTSTPDSAGTVAFSTAALTVNTHRVTMTVTDELGEVCASAITWTVGTPPSIELELPTDGEVVNEGEALAFRAAVSDAEDVADDLWVTWESDVDGVFHEGPPDSDGLAQFFDDARSAGDHALTVTVTDSAGLTARALGTFSVNGAPSSPGVSIAPGSPSTSDDLRASVDAASVDPDGDTVVYAYAWYVDGVLSGASVTDVLPASATTVGERWTVAVTGTDGLAGSAAGTASVTIVNTAPVVTASLSPGSPTRASTLTCTGGTTDADGGSPALSFRWTVDGATVAATTTSAATSTLVGAFGAGDDVTCTVSADDGDGGTASAIDSVTIGNTAPVAGVVTLAPTTAYTDDTLTATAGATDADGDTLAVTYAWYVDGLLVTSGVGNTLDGSTWFSRDQVVEVVVTADDGTDTDTSASASVTISNAVPRPPGLTITSDPLPGDDVTCTVSTESADADGDAITYTFAWTVDGAAYTGATDAPLSSTVPGEDVAYGDTWACTVSASDGTDAVTTREETTVTFPYACSTSTYGTSEYLFCTDRIEEPDARAACEDWGGDLVTVSDSAEDAWLMSTAQAIESFASGAKWWIGFNDEASEGSFVWRSGQAVTWTNWGTGEPNNSYGSSPEDCTVLIWAPSVYGRGSWNDLPCTGSVDSTQTFICER